MNQLIVSLAGIEPVKVGDYYTVEETDNEKKQVKTFVDCVVTKIQDGSVYIEIPTSEVK